MNALASTCEEILIVPDVQPPKPGARGRWRVVRRLLVTAAVSLGVALISIYVVNSVRESRRELCRGHLTRLGQALCEYQDVHGHLPSPALAGSGGTPLLSWRVALLPHLGYRSLFDQFHLDEPWDSPHNRALIAQMPPEFACPSSPGRRPGDTRYLVVVGPTTDLGNINTAFEPARGVDLREITDGTSRTVLVFETATPVPWTKPDDLHWAQGGPLPRLASPHSGGAHVLFADGAARFLRDTTSAEVLRGLLTINGGEVLSSG
jgi:prepilin-type processing-associated H-X9-DG protein